MYKIYLDNVEMFDLPKGLENFAVQIVREDGFNSSEQILREKTETDFLFYGDCYIYLSELFKNGACSIVDVRIEDVCDNVTYELFIGKLHISDIECDVKRKMIKSNIRDNSFTGMIKDFTKTDVPIYYTKTKNCFELESIDRLFIINPLIPELYKEILGFDVLEVLNYQIKYATDNKAYVVSDYLTTNKYMITNGYNLHNDSGSLEQKYPNVSFNKLFEELRKKFRLFMVIEYDVDGIPYLRIEQESYSFSSTNILSISDIQDSTTEEIDKTRLYNSIKVGSKIFEPKTGVYWYNEKSPILSFIESTFPTCGECTVNSDSEQNELNLVSEFIIDSNMISEAFNTPIGDLYDYDANIYLISYYVDIAYPYPLITMNTCNGHGGSFNCTLTNQNVVNNWLGYSPQCLTLSRYSSDYFRLELKQATIEIKYPALFQNDVVEFNNIIADNNNTITLSTTQSIYLNLNPPIGAITTSATFSYYKCSKNGTYNLIAEIINIHQDGTINPSIISVDYTLYIVVYTDDTFTTISSQYSVVVNSTDSINDLKTLIIETGLITITIGQCVLVDYSVEIASLVPTLDYPFVSESINFYQKEDLSKCEEFENENQDSKYRLIKFSKELCQSDFQYIKNNKRGNITVDGKVFYIKNLTYRKNKLTDFELIGNSSLL